MRRAAVAALAVLALGACRGPERPSHVGHAALDADVRVSPTPAAVGSARVFVQATDEGRPAENAAVRVRADPADGDGASTTASGDGWHTAEPAPATPGGYGPVAVAVSVTGAWRVVVEITASDGRRATIRHPLAVVAGPGGS